MLNIFLQNDVFNPSGVSNVLLEKGVTGVFILVLLFFIWKLWLAKESRDSYLREQNVKITNVLQGLSGLIDQVYQNTNNLPENVKEKLDPKISQIARDTEELKVMSNQIKDKLKD